MARHLWLFRPLAFSVALAAASPSLPVSAQSGADFFRGKTMEFIIGSEPGGGYDTYGRAIASHIVKHIPGNPTIVPKNMPGAGSLRALQYMNTVAAKDGTSISILNPSMINLSVVDPDKVGVDLNTMIWLGNVSSDNKVCVTWAKSPVSTLDDLKTKTFRLGGTSTSAGSHPPAAILKYIFPNTVHHVLGYSANSQIWVALERGEVEGNCTGWGIYPTQKPDWVREKLIRPLVKFTNKEIAGIEGVPSIYGLPIQDNLKSAIAFLMKADDITRPVMAPPGIPAEHAAILREAFAKMLKDPEFLDFAKKTRLEIDATSHQELAAIIKDITSTKPDDVALAKKLIE